MKDSKNGQWYTKLKKMCKYDQHKSESITVQEIEHLSNEEQAEAIADSFSAISHRYQPIDRSQITVPPFSPKSIPQFTLAQVRKCLSKIKTNKSTAPCDIPPKIIKQFSMYLGTPLADIINSSLSSGHWPTLYKKEIPRAGQKNSRDSRLLSTADYESAGGGSGVSIGPRSDGNP